MNLEEQVKQHKELSRQIADLEAKRKILGVDILQQMTSKVLDISNFIVRHHNRLSISVSMEEARKYEAVKMEEVIDKAKLKALYNEGQPIVGITEINFVQITEKKPVTAESESIAELQ